MVVQKQLSGDAHSEEKANKTIIALASDAYGVMGPTYSWRIGL
jgi:hypothetical protein